MMARMVEEMPLRTLVMMSGGQVSAEMVNGLLLLMNGKVVQGTIALVRASRANRQRPGPAK